MRSLNSLQKYALGSLYTTWQTSNRSTNQHNYQHNYFNAVILSCLLHHPKEQRNQTNDTYMSLLTRQRTSGANLTEGLKLYDDCVKDTHALLVV